MDDSEIRVVTLEPIRIATSYGFGKQPEEIAWENMKQWAQPKGLLANLEAYPLFGCNNPYPAPGSTNYGYEFWLAVGPGVEPRGNIRIGEFFGGMYAVARCEVHGDPGGTIPSGWQELGEWCKRNKRRRATHPALERFLGTPDDLDHLVLILHYPILE